MPKSLEEWEGSITLYDIYDHALAYRIKLSQTIRNIVQIWFMILKQFKFSLPDTLVICFMKHKKTLYKKRRNWSDATRYAGQGFSSFSLYKSPSTELICSFYEYGSLQNYIISYLLWKHVLLFPQYSSNWCYGSQALKCVKQITWVSTWKPKK